MIKAGGAGRKERAAGGGGERSRVVVALTREPMDPAEDRGTHSPVRRLGDKGHDWSTSRTLNLTIVNIQDVCRTRPHRRLFEYTCA